MHTATLLSANLPQFCPVTHHYALSGGPYDGQHVLVTIASMDVPGTVSHFLGVPIAIDKAQLPTGADVFLSDADATVLDADGDPANGMTPLASYEVDSHAAALAELGYTEAPS